MSCFHTQTTLLGCTTSFVPHMADAPTVQPKHKIQVEVCLISRPVSSVDYANTLSLPLPVSPCSPPTSSSLTTAVEQHESKQLRSLILPFSGGQRGPMPSLGSHTPVSDGKDRSSAETLFGTCGLFSGDLKFLNCASEGETAGWISQSQLISKELSAPLKGSLPIFVKQELTQPFLAVSCPGAPGSRVLPNKGQPLLSWTRGVQGQATHRIWKGFAMTSDWARHGVISGAVPVISTLDFLPEEGQEEGDHL